MSQRTIKQQARRTAREMGEKRRKEREERERRVIDLAEQDSKVCRKLADRPGAGQEMSPTK